MKFTKLISPLLLSALFLSACSFSLAADVTPPPGYQAPVAQAQPTSLAGPQYPVVPPDPVQGEAIFAEKCTSCHGASGKGDGQRAAQLPNPVAAIGTAGVARQASPASWFSVVTQGNLERFMPPFASLTDRQRWDVVAYAYTLSATPDSVAKGAELFKANCARCHGDQAKGDGPDAAGLAKPPRDLTGQAFMASQAAANLFQTITTGVAPSMPAFGNNLSETERWDLTDYLRSLTFAPALAAAPAGAASTPALASTLAPGATQVVSSTQVASAQTAITQTLGTITGTVTNGSGGPVPTDLTVTLHGFDQMQTVITQTTTLQSGGKFSFNNVELAAGRMFVASVSYAGASYGSDVVTAQGGEPNLNLPISIFETTSDASTLSVDRLHLFFEFPDPKTLRVIELQILSNSGQKTVVPPGAGQPTVSFKLPDGASNLQFQNGELGGRYVQTPGGFGDTAPVSPGSGSNQVLFAYDLPYDRKIDLAQTITLRTNAVVILVPANTIQVKGDQLQDGGTRDVQGTQYQMYNGLGLNAGDTLRLTVSGGSSGSSALNLGSQPSLIIGIAAFGVALVLAGVWLFLRNRQTRAIALAGEADVEPLAGPEAENAESLMDAILALDDLYRAGKLPEEAYHQRRAELKTRLREVMGIGD
ncbi:MAG TPA: c-type cytochrome [Anaerolineales bacterium]